jgi:hypothetical protein
MRVPAPTAAVLVSVATDRIIVPPQIELIGGRELNAAPHAR